MPVQTIEQILAEETRRKVLLWGPAKNGGKSTFGLTAPGPILDLQYDIGSPPLPPGMDTKGFVLKTYPPADASKIVSIEHDKWDRPKNVGQEIIRDLLEVRNAFVENRPIKLDGVEIPLPKTLILDGMVAFDQHFVDWMMGVNNTKEMEIRDWGRRLANKNTLFNMILPLPCNVVLITWETFVTRSEKDKKGNNVQVQTDVRIPDIGGKMDVWASGKVDASLYCYADTVGLNNTRYKVRTRGNELIQGCGVRGIYTLADVEDVTINVKQPHPLPWERIFTAK